MVSNLLFVSLIRHSGEEGFTVLRTARCIEKGKQFQVKAKELIEHAAVNRNLTPSDPDYPDIMWELVVIELCLVEDLCKWMYILGVGETRKRTKREKEKVKWT